MPGDYAGVDSNGLAVSGIWNSDSYLHDTSLTLVELTGEADVGWYYTNGAWVAPLVGINEVRRVRDELLRSSDEMITRHREHEYLKANRSNTRFDGKDYGNIAEHLTENQYHDWLVYRQELRDLPDGYTPVANPTYPTKPS